MPKFEARNAGVQVRDDNGRMLGTASAGGRLLSSADALAQLGYVEDPEADGGVRSLAALQAEVQAADMLVAVAEATDRAVKRASAPAAKRPAAKRPAKKAS